MTDVRTLLHDLAADAPAGRGPDTADRVVEVHRLQDRRRLRWAGVAAVLAVVVAAAPSVLGSVRAPDSAVAARGSAEVSRGLYDVPTRGSLAGDDDLLLQAVSTSWDDGSGDDDLVAALDSRRVSFLGEVPGDQVWALVLGLHDGELVQAWFADATPGDGISFQLVSGPARAFPDTPMALQDLASTTGPLVVVTSPGDEVSYAADGQGGVDDPDPVFSPLRVDDGVAVAEVANRRPGAAPGYLVGRAGAVVYRSGPDGFDSTVLRTPLGIEVPVAVTPPGEEFGQRMADCLAPLGYQVTPRGDGGYQVVGGSTEIERAAFAAAEQSCLVQTGYR